MPAQVIKAHQLHQMHIRLRIYVPLLGSMYHHPLACQVRLTVGDNGCILGGEYVPLIYSHGSHQPRTLGLCARTVSQKTCLHWQDCWQTMLQYTGRSSPSWTRPSYSKTSTDSQNGTLPPIPQNVPGYPSKEATTYSKSSCPSIEARTYSK